MNRLILIGNGFDLAHGLKTGYNDFILWYLKTCFQSALDNQAYDDELISIKRNFTQEFRINNINTISQYIDYYYVEGFEDLLNNRDLDIKSTRFHPYFNVSVKSKFLKDLLFNCTSKSWVDIENQYYKELKTILTVYKNSDERLPLRALNHSLNEIIIFLADYLSGLNHTFVNEDISRILDEKVASEEIVMPCSANDFYQENTLVLSFNYTDTINNYRKLNNQNRYNYEVNYIHGQLLAESNPLIFGFGDELDDSYLIMEQSNNKGFLEHIKSFWYFKTSNYHNLIRYIDSSAFQVYIWGHSCGLSDRTMLNMIFEHENCKSIKIFYHETAKGNNYTSLTQEISRHFHNKAVMRRKIVPFDKSSPLPQIS